MSTSMQWPTSAATIHLHSIERRLITDTTNILMDEARSTEDRIKRAQAMLRVWVQASANACLSPRENAVLKLICGGLSNKCIARSLGIAPETVKSHAKHILKKLNARTRAEAVALAAELNLLI